MPSSLISAVDNSASPTRWKDAIFHMGKSRHTRDELVAAFRARGPKTKGNRDHARLASSSVKGRRRKSTQQAVGREDISLGTPRSYSVTVTVTAYLSPHAHGDGCQSTRRARHVTRASWVRRFPRWAPHSQALCCVAPSPRHHQCEMRTSG